MLGKEETYALACLLYVRHSPPPFLTLWQRALIPFSRPENVMTLVDVLFQRGRAINLGFYFIFRQRKARDPSSREGKQIATVRFPVARAEEDAQTMKWVANGLFA